MTTASSEANAADSTPFLRTKTAYWIATGLFCAFFTAGGIGHLFRLSPMVDGMVHLGFPLYVMTILGVAKLLGVVALLAPGRPVLKEWAYAGFTFNLLGAIASHVFAGDPFSEFAAPCVLVIVLAVSYSARPAEKRLVPMEVPS